MPTFLLLLCSVLRNAVRSRHDLLLENLALRQQLAVLSRQQRRPRLQPAGRLFWSWLSRMWPGWQSALALVRPETVIRWQHTAWRQYWVSGGASNHGVAMKAVVEVGDGGRLLAEFGSREGTIGEQPKLVVSYTE